MGQQLITDVGCFTTGTKDKINENFTELYAGSGGSIVHQASVTLTNAQIKHLPTLPAGEITIAPAAGANTLLLLISGMVFGQFANAYTNVDGDCYFDIENFGIGAGSGSLYQFGSGFFDTPGSLLAYLSPFIDVLTDPGPFTGPKAFGYQNFDVASGLNQPLSLTVVNTAGDFTGGNATNTLRVSLAYLILNVTTGLFE